MDNGIATLCAALRSVGVDCVFGLPGTQIIELFEGFREAKLRTVLAAHELGAAFMAVGYYRSSGKVAALATIPGPGFTYALTGLAEARHDSAALLYLVGKPARGPGRRFQLQALDQRAMAGPVLKGTFELTNPADADRIVREAYHLATHGEPGPVMIELDVRALANEGAAADAAPPVVAQPDAESVRRLAAAFAGAQRPVFLLGQGSAGAAGDLLALIERCRIPVVTTPSGRGIIPEDHPMALGFDPLRGHTSSLNSFLDEADLVVGLGCKLGHNGSVGFQLRLVKERFVHVGADAAVVQANYEAEIAVVARVEDVVPALAERTAVSRWDSGRITSIRAALRRVEEGVVEPAIQASRSMAPSEFFSALRATFPRDGAIVTDSGLHQIMTRRYLDVLTPRGLIVPSDFQSMGFGIPAAIGAMLAHHRRPVLAIVGDGGFFMAGLELATACRERLPLGVVVFNDGQLNQIRLQQLGNFGHTHAVELARFDYEAFAMAMAMDYRRFDGTPASLSGAWSGERPTLVEVVVGDSPAMRRLQAVARVKGMARRVLGSRIREWLKSRLRRKR